MKTLAGGVAVVTGGGRGIGAATARALSDAGLNVVVAARNRDQIERQTAELVALGRQARAVVCDVTSEASVEALSREAAELGPVAVLVNNAGAAASMPVVRTSLEDRRPTRTYASSCHPMLNLGNFRARPERLGPREDKPPLPERRS